MKRGFVAIAACNIFFTANDFSVGCTYTVDFLLWSSTNSFANARRFINSFRISNSSSKSSAFRHSWVFWILKAAWIFCLYSLGRDEPPAPILLWSAGRGGVYTGEPRDAALGADVVLKLLFGELGAGATGCFYKECSKPGTPLEAARSAEESWVA